MSISISEIRSKFWKLDSLLKGYGKTKCTFYKNGTCSHPTMGLGGVVADTDCKVDNCPFVLYKKVK